MGVVHEASKNLPLFTGGSKHSVTDTGENGTKSHQSANDGRAAG